MPTKAKKRSPEQENRVRAWRQARIDHYVRTRNPRTLAEMLISLEDAHGFPEFDIDEEWPK